MRYIIGYKFAYILLLIGGLIIGILDIGKMVYDESRTPRFYIPPAVPFVGVLSLLKSSIFLGIHIPLFKKILNKELGPLFFVLEVSLSVGRIIMSLLFPLWKLTGLVILSPVLNSLWIPASKYLQGPNATFLFCCVLASMEIAYVALLIRKKNQFRINVETGTKISIKELIFRINARNVSIVLILPGAFLLFLIIAQTMQEGNPGVINSVDLIGPTKKRYMFKIPSAYLVYAKGDSAELRSAYLGMIGYSPETRNRFKDTNGNRNDDLVRIFISVNDRPVSSAGEFANQNDLGRFHYHGILKNPDYKLSPVPKILEESQRVVIYEAPRYKGYQKMHVITQEDQRTSVITCNFEAVCEGQTTWKGEFAIKYDFSRKYFDKMVDVDRSVVTLVDSFNPELMNSPP